MFNYVSGTILFVSGDVGNNRWNSTFIAPHNLYKTMCFHDTLKNILVACMIHNLLDVTHYLDIPMDRLMCSQGQKRKYDPTSGLKLHIVVAVSI